MFASTLNEIASSVRCVSSIIVVLNAKLWTKKTMRIEEARQKCRFLLVETHKRWTSTAVLTVHAETNLLYTFQRPVQANRNINQWQKKAPIYKLSRRKAPKTQQICYYRHARKTSGLFLLYDTGFSFNSCNNFANLVFFAKVSVPLAKFPCWQLDWLCSCLPYILYLLFKKRQ